MQTPSQDSKSGRINLIDHKQLPPTYIQNSQRETLLLDYASQFESTFLTQYSQRKPLFISPLNEAKVSKFLPTTLRPAVLADPLMINGNKLSNFVASSVTYDELEDPTAPPQYIVAPQTTLEWQSGDCFDMSILLASLLIGAGYNAYVVSGYADRRLTQQIRQKEPAPQVNFNELMRWTQRGFAVEATFAKRNKQGIFRVSEKYCRQVTDFQEIETKFKNTDWILDQQKPTIKEVENLWFRVEVEPESSDTFVDMKVNNQEVKEKIVEARIQELKYCLMQGGDLLSDRCKSYGYSLMCLPEGEDLKSVGAWFSNKYIQQRPLLQDSEFQRIDKMRQKMEAIGATKLEIEAYVIEEMRKAHKLDDILVPGETGQRVKADEQKREKEKSLKEKQHISDLCNDTLQGQRVYSWVYVAPLQPKDAKLPTYNKTVETNVNTLISQFNLPTDVKSGMFIDSASGRVFTLTNDLFLGIESMFNHENYFVNLQDNTNGIQKFSYDIFDMQSWCICIMTQMMVEIRQAQKDYKNKLQVQEGIINEVGGKNNLFLQGINNTNQQIKVPGDALTGATNGLKPGIDLPEKIQGRIDQKLKDDEQINFQTITKNKQLGDKKTDYQADLLAIETNTVQSLYQQRWDSVTPVRLLMSSLPASWPVQTTLSELKILQNYPLRPKLNYEHVTEDLIPEKTSLFKDCFVRQFNEFSQRSGCTMIVVCRPRPVYSFFYDNDGDKIGQEITGWRVVRYQYFEHRIDKLKVKMTQFHIQHSGVQLQDDKVDPDIFLQKNDGAEIITELDALQIEFNNKLFPIWCFVGEDLDFVGTSDTLVNFKVTSMINNIQANLITQRQIFDQGRPDMVMLHINMPSGQRKTYFYPFRSDSLGCSIHYMGQRIENRYYDLLRLDGLKERTLFYCQDAINDKSVIKMTISEFREDDLIMKDVVIYVSNIQEEFRDLGCIQMTINKRRRRLIQAKYAIINADLQELQGLREAEEKAELEKNAPKNGDEEQQEIEVKKQDVHQKIAISELEKEDAIMNCDIFGDIEEALTQAVYKIYVAQKQLFTQNQSSAYNPLYQVQQGVLQLVRRQEDSMMLAYNLCPDPAEAQATGSSAEGQSATQDQTLNQTDASNLSSSQIEDSQTQESQDQEEAGGRAGAAFWRRTAKLLQQQDCNQTTDFLKDDINNLINDRQINLPKSIASKMPAANRRELVENELRKTQITNLIGVKMNYFDKGQNLSKFDLANYVTLLKKREMPIFPQFDSGTLSYDYVQQLTKDPFRIQEIHYMLTKNCFRVLDFADEPKVQNLQQLFDHDQGYVHFSYVFSSTGELQTEMSHHLALQIQQKKLHQLQLEQMQQSTKQNAFQKKPPAHLQQIQTQAPFQTIKSLPISEQYDESLPKTSIMKISIEDTLLTQRQQQLSQQLVQEHQSLFDVINSVERNDETKIVEQASKQVGFSNVLMLQYQTRAKGLYFRPRDLTVARHTLAQHGLQDRFNLQVVAIEKSVKTLDGSDYLAVFIPEKYRSLEVLPPEVASKVFAECLAAMKERIMERSGIIQGRLQAEMEYLKKKNVAYNKNVTQLTEEAKRQILAEIREAIFKLKILEHRSNRHSQEGAQRYVELEQRLRADPRLKNMIQ